MYARFLRPDGAELVLPGVSERDTISYRIEALKVYLELQIGDVTLIETYNYLHDES